MTEDAIIPPNPAPAITRPTRTIVRERQTRGRAAAEATVDAGSAVGEPGASQSASGEPDPYDMSQYSRRAISESFDTPFEVPQAVLRAGWDYEWKLVTVLNEVQNAGGSISAFEHGQGWRPVPARDLKVCLPPGYTKPVFEHLGQIFCMRPKHLSTQAKEELFMRAETQKAERLRSALSQDPAGNFTHDKRMPRTAATITLEGEVGVHDQKFDRAPLGR